MVKSKKYMSIEQPESEYKPDPGHALVVIKRDNQHVGEYRTQSIWNKTDVNSRLVSPEQVVRKHYESFQHTGP